MRLTGEPGRLLRRGVDGVLDLLLPPLCLSCRGPVLRPGLLCGNCWSTLRFLAEPLCGRCGLPFEFDPGDGVLCAGCLRAPPAFDRARSALLYDAASKPLVLRFKHADRTDMAAALAAWMQRAGAPLLAEADLLVPVPLHWRRLFARRYNQSALLAAALARGNRLPMEPRLLLRRRNTPSQGGLGRSGRHRNVAGAFALHPRRAGVLAGCAVVLVDDVMTTGATLDACARQLRRGGARRVDVLTLARVAGPEGAP